MSVYVMSDIHGCFNEFEKMLNLIGFSQNDQLYIIGDAVDRGKEPVKVLDYIMNHSNIILMRGNHENFLTYCLESSEYYIWYANGGKITHEQIMLRGEEYKDKVLKYISKCKVITVIGKYILVHASLKFSADYENITLKDFLEIQNEDVCLWGRDNIGDEKQFQDYTVICGHTPVQAIDESIKEQEDVKILHRKGTIYIDCGCCYGTEAGGKLACIRLDDMKEFYVNFSEE